MAVVALVLVPVAVASMSLVGEPWVVMSDWASLALRTDQVGTRATPLVGPYSFHGFAHPGPLSYWVAAPLYHLMGEDARSLLWTGAIVNTMVVAALAAVAWRRGRWPLLLGAMVLVALVTHGLGAWVLVNMWNPHTPLLALLLTVFLVWDAALGRRRAVTEAVLPASYAMQAHLAMVPLVGALVAGAFAWWRWGPRLVEGWQPDGVRDGGEPRHEGGPRWRRAVDAVPRSAVVLAAVLWVGPLLDAVFDMHNPVRIAIGVLTPKGVAGLGRAPGLAGDFLAPAGSWVRGDEPLQRVDIDAGGTVGLVVALVALACCLAVSRRLRLPDAAALTILTSALVAVSVAGAANLVVPTDDYLTEWLKLVGGLVWFTVGWTAWRAAERRMPARHPGRRLAGTMAIAAVAATTAWSWGPATRVTDHLDNGADLVGDMREGARRGLRPDVEYRVEFAGDDAGHFPGFVYWLAEDGFDVVTSSGEGGLKWGHEHRWTEGEDYEQALMVVSHRRGSGDRAWDDCMQDPDLDPIFTHDPLTAAERAWLDDYAFRNLGGPDAVTDAERARAGDLVGRGPMVAMLTGDHLCGLDDPPDPVATGVPGD